MTGQPRIDKNVEMSGSAVTPPKGRATRARNDDVGRTTISPKVQWALAIIAALAVLGAILYIGRDVRSDFSGAPIDSDVAVVAVAPPG